MPRPISELVDRCLAKTRDARPADALALRAELRELRGLPPTRAVRVIGDAALADTAVHIGAPGHNDTGLVSAAAELSDVTSLNADAGRPWLGFAGVAVMSAMAVLGVLSTLVDSSPIDGRPPAAVEPVAAVATLASPATETSSPLENAYNSPEGADVSTALAPTTTTASIMTSPAGATVRLGDRVLGSTPLDVALAHGTDPIAVHIEREGYEPRDIEIVPDVDRSIEEALVAVEQRVKARPPSKRSPAPRRSAKRATAKRPPAAVATPKPEAKPPAPKPEKPSGFEVFID